MLELTIAAALAFGTEPLSLSPTSDPATKASPPSVPRVGSTGEIIYSGAEINAMGGTPPKLLTAPKAPNVEALYRQGIQGEMYFVGYVGADGRMHDVTLPTSSRSVELDSIGLALVNASTFTPAYDASGKPIAAKVTFPVHFWKDSMMNPAFSNKSCEQFIIDADWHSSAFPEQRPDEYRGWLLFSGVMLAQRYALNKTAEPAPKFEEVYARCKAHPNWKFIDVYMGR